MTLSEKIKIYLTESVFEVEVVTKMNIELRNDSDGNGDYISKWEYADKLQPTQEQLDAIEWLVLAMVNVSVVSRCKLILT